MLQMQNALKSVCSGIQIKCRMQMQCVKEYSAEKSFCSVDLPMKKVLQGS